MKRLAGLSVAAVVALATATLVLSGGMAYSVDPAVASSHVIKRTPKRAPARGHIGSPRSPKRGNKMGLMPGDGNPDHANGGNGPGGRY